MKTIIKNSLLIILSTALIACGYTLRGNLNLPDDVKQDGIKASMKDGVLALEIPRIEKIDSKVKKISIK